MRKLFDLFAEDITSESFTKNDYVYYGCLAPAAIVVIMFIAGWLALL